jgi:5-methylcytosine-specific restriction endonuclease McrA
VTSEKCVPTPEDRQTLFRIAHWTLKQKYLRVAKVRELAGTEENYRLIIREIDRVKAQLQQALLLNAEATLTLVDWLITLDGFNWYCAYCQSKPFEVMSHLMPIQLAGTTPENCVPACYRCRAGKGKLSGLSHVQVFLGNMHESCL